MVMFPSAMAEVDSILEDMTRKIWHLHNNFPKAALHAPPEAALHAPPEELGLNIPTIWEDYCSTAIRS